MRIYSNDEKLIFGRRVKPQHWSEDEATRGFSVNCVNCTCEAPCSVALNEHASQYRHVVEIDLVELGKLIQKDQLRALYEPEGGVCHFNIVSLDESPLVLFMSIRDALAEELAFPKGPRMPEKDADIKEAHRIAGEYRLVFKIHADVVPKEEPAFDTLAEPAPQPPVAIVEVLDMRREPD